MSLDLSEFQPLSLQSAASSFMTYPSLSPRIFLLEVADHMTLKSNRRIGQYLVAIFCCCNASQAWAQMTFTTIDREISARAGANTASSTSVLAGVFDEQVRVMDGDIDCFVDTLALQHTVIDSTRINGTGSAGMGQSCTSPSGEATSSVLARFFLDAPATYELTGNIFSFGPTSTSLRMGDRTFFEFESTGADEINFSETGTLPIGTYEFQTISLAPNWSEINSFRFDFLVQSIPEPSAIATGIIASALCILSLSRSKGQSGHNQLEAEERSAT